MTDIENSPAARLLALAEQLLARGKEGKVAWQATDDADAFLYVGTKSSVRIESIRGVQRFCLVLLDQDGREIEALGGAVQNDDGSWSEAASMDTLDALFVSARRQARDLDSAIDTLMVDLEGEPTRRRPPWMTVGYDEEPF
jgi:hypothetical protein